MSDKTITIKEKIAIECVDFEYKKLCQSCKLPFDCRGLDTSASMYCGCTYMNNPCEED